MVNTPIPILALDQQDLAHRLGELGAKPMHARQIRRWLVQGRADSFAAMSDLPKQLRDTLGQQFLPLGTAIVHNTCSSDGTRKLLLRLPDLQTIECVLIPDRDRRTACISTQVGCGMGCVFCASGLDGVARNLQPWEILEQLLHLRNSLPPSERITHIVVMGMGEPLANLDHLLAALDVAGSPDGLGIGARNITISTVGLPQRIRRLADSGKQYHLAVSLHAPNDILRNRIVPTNDKIGLDAILAASDDFFQRTGRQVTYEYVLLHGINDAPSHARELAARLKGRIAHVNVIPFNPVEGLPYQTPSAEALHNFCEVLRRHGISIKVRKRKGSKIDAACGQLRRRQTSTADTRLSLNVLDEPADPLGA